MAFCSYLETLAQYLLVEEMNKWIQLYMHKTYSMKNVFYTLLLQHIIIILEN